MLKNLCKRWTRGTIENVFAISFPTRFQRRTIPNIARGEGGGGVLSPAAVQMQTAILPKMQMSHGFCKENMQMQAPSRKRTQTVTRRAEHERDLSRAFYANAHYRKTLKQRLCLPCGICPLRSGCARPCTSRAETRVQFISMQRESLKRRQN